MFVPVVFWFWAVSLIRLLGIAGYVSRLFCFVLLVPALFQSFSKIGTRFLQCNQRVTSVFRVLFQCSSHFRVWEVSWRISPFKEVFLRVHSIDPQIFASHGFIPKKRWNIGTSLYIYIFYNYIIIIFQQLNPQKQSPILFQSTGTTLEQLEQKTRPVSAKKITYNPCSICKVML